MSSDHFLAPRSNYSPPPPRSYAVVLVVHKHLNNGCCFYHSFRYEYTPETVPVKAFKDLSTIYYWRHAAGKRTPPMPRKPDVMKEIEKEGAAQGPVRVGGLEDITEMKLLRTPGESPPLFSSFI